MLSLKQVNFDYTADGRVCHALRQVDVTVTPGEVLGLIGPSGAGKSTLLGVLNLLLAPSSGVVSIDGKQVDYTNFSALKNHRSIISTIFQNYNLLSRSTVLENIALPLALSGQAKKQRLEEAQTYLSWVGLTDYADAYPDALSGGQKQRVAIARALISKPRYLLCDEPTAALDQKTTAEILTLLQRVKEDFGVALVVVTHELSVIKSCADRVAVIADGQIIEQGPILDVLLKPQDTRTKALVNSKIHQAAAQVRRFCGDIKRLYQLTFSGESAVHPLIADLTARFGVEINLLNAQLEVVHEALVGHTLCDIVASDDKREQAIAYLREQSVQVEEV